MFRLLATLALFSLIAPSLAQSPSSTASSASPSASGTGGDPQVAQARYLSDVVQTLNAANLTSLVNVATTIANTSEGQTLLAQLAGNNKTLLAPNDAAFARLPASTLNDPQALVQILSYHVVNVTLDPAQFPITPQHAIGRSLLNGGDFRLPGNRSAACACQRVTESTQGWQVVQATAGNANSTGFRTEVNNLRVFVMDAVLDLPTSVSEAGSRLFPAVANLARPLGILDTLESTVGVTLFAPVDSALTGLEGALGSFSQTQIGALLGNHIINGSVAYSDDLTAENYTSSSGQPFRFSTNSSGTYVQSANATARVVQSDIITENGVVHLIDRVLVNVASDPAAASSAYASASSAATLPDRDTGPTSSAASRSGSASATATGSPSAAATSSRSGEAQKASWGMGTIALGFVMVAVAGWMGL